MSTFKLPTLQNTNIIEAALGRKPNRVPIWVMRQAGRYLPEFQEFRRKHSFFEICKDPELASEVTLLPINKYDLDAAIIFSDILVIPQALGMQVDMVAGVGPHMPEPLTIPEIPKLRSVSEALESLHYVGKAITVTRQKLNGKVPLFGFSGAPWTLMSYMIEGGGSKTYSKARRWLYGNPIESHRLLQLLTDIIIGYLVMQIESGAQIVQLFDSNAEYLNKKLYSTFGLPYLKQISDGVRRKLTEKGVSPVPMVLFAKGGWYCLEEQADLGYEVLGIDWTVEPTYARKVLKGKNVTVQGNLDPAALYAAPEELKRYIEEMVKEFGTERFIANLGHGIYPDAPLESVAIFVESVHSFKV